MPVTADRALRVSPEYWLDEDFFDRLLAQIDLRSGLVEEIALFSSFTHAPLPLSTIAVRMKTARVRMTEARCRGYSAGINVLATIGHHEEDLAHAAGEEIGYGTDLFGVECRGSLCPTSPRLMERIHRQYAHVASAEPDFIWVDDDVRLFGHMPVRATCFCTRCLEMFAEECGTSLDRESLRRTFDEGGMYEKLEVRKAWLEHNRKAIAKVLCAVEASVHDVKPDIELGFMTGERLFEGYDFPGWAAALAGAGHKRIRWRPGGGFYVDRTPDLLLEKAHQIGRQASLLPPDRTGSVQAELENFPYQGLSKSRTITLTECAADIAAGCTGIAYNILPPPRDGLSEALPLMDALAGGTPFLHLMAAAFHGARREGLFASWNQDAMATANIGGGSWLDGSSADFSAAFPLELYQIGIPPGYAPEGAVISAVRGDTVAVLQEDEIATMFAGGVYLDGRALAHICASGHWDLVGCAPGDRFDADCIEEFTDHELNGEMPGVTRDTRQSFWHEPAFSIVPGDDTETISRLVDYAGDEVCPSAMTVFENSLGGRVCVSGYSPWTMLHSRAKTRQLRSVMRWLSKDTLGAYVASYHRVSIWYARTPGGPPVVAAVNCSLDRAEGVGLHVSGTSGVGTVVDDTLAETEIQSIRTDGPYQCYELPAIQPWKIVLIRF